MLDSIHRLAASADRVQQRHVALAFPVAVVRKLSEDQGGSYAALIAYYGLLSAFPLLLVFAAVLGFVLAGHPDIQATVLRTTDQSFPAMARIIGRSPTGSGSALGIGLAAALWAGLGVTRATERAMNAIWDIPLSERPNLWWSRVRGLAVLLVLGTTFLVSAGLASLSGTGGLLAVPTDVVTLAGPLVLNTALYLLAFQALTNRHLAWRAVVPGAVIGAVGWTALQHLADAFARHEIAHASALYGSLAAVIGLVAWVHLGALLTLVAAEVNVVLAERLWPRSLGSAADTDADRRTLVRQAQEARRSVGETITVSFRAASAPGGAGADCGGTGAGSGLDCATTPDRTGPPAGTGAIVGNGVRHPSGADPADDAAAHPSRP